MFLLSNLTFIYLLNLLAKCSLCDSGGGGGVFLCQSHDSLVGHVYPFFLTESMVSLSCLASLPTLKSSADTDVRNVPWYLMSGNILASFSLAFWRIRAADSWCEILASSHILMNVANGTTQVTIIQQNVSITFFNNNLFDRDETLGIKLSHSIQRFLKDICKS